MITCLPQSTHKFIFVQRKYLSLRSIYTHILPYAYYIWRRSKFGYIGECHSTAKFIFCQYYFEFKITNIVPLIQVYRISANHLVANLKNIDNRNQQSCRSVFHLLKMRKACLMTSSCSFLMAELLMD